MPDPDESWKRLKSWIGTSNGTHFEASIDLCMFDDTGRGIKATKPIKKGELLLSVPLHSMISTTKAKEILRSEYPSQITLSNTQMLVAFMMIHSMKRDHQWIPYFNTIPSTFNLPVFSLTQCQILPRWAREPFEIQKKRIETDLRQVRSVLGKHEFDRDLFKWAWCAVNTRCVNLTRDKELALVPVFDMLNHSDQVSTHIEYDGTFFKLISTQDYDTNDQVFINYGPHDNLFLWREYGFYLPMLTKFDAYNVDEIVQKMMMETLEMKKIILQNHYLDTDLTISIDGPSWRLCSALKLLACTNDELKLWDQFLVGNLEIISDSNEERYRTLFLRVFDYALHESNQIISSTETSPDIKTIMKNMKELLIRTKGVSL